MKSEPARKRTLWNFLILPIGFAGITIISFLLVYLEQLSSTPCHSDTGVPCDLLDGLGGVFIGILLSLVFIIYWNIRMVKDLIEFRSNQNFVRINLFILIGVYLLVSLILWKLFF